jgi:tagatose-1,6-bisphosphate aldolase
MRKQDREKSGEIIVTPGKYHHLSRATTPAGHFVILAIDHRANLLKALSQHRRRPVDEREFMQFKQSLVKTLAPYASAVLTDPAYGIGAGIASLSIPGSIGLLAPIEVTNYDLRPSQREVQLIPGWSVGKIKRVGGDGVKLLLPYHPDEATADARRAVVRRLIDECGRADIPLYLEPITYSLDETKGLTSQELTQITVAMAREFAAMGADILKLQFPVDPSETTDAKTWHSACADVTIACGNTPWALLSAGVSFETFVQQATVACGAGAAGVIAGRAVWNDTLGLEGPAQTDYLRTTGVERMKTLATLCAEHATAWHSRVSPPSAADDWHEHYDDLFT